MDDLYDSAWPEAHRLKDGDDNVCGARTGHAAGVREPVPLDAAGAEAEAGTDSRQHKATATGLTFGSSDCGWPPERVKRYQNLGYSEERMAELKRTSS